MSSEERTVKSVIADFIDCHHLLFPDKLQLVAVSGGADSVALLLLLRLMNYAVEAVHCNFHLRGEESDRDEQFVRQLCEKNGVKLHLIHFDTKTYAETHQVSLEMAARELRYRYFEQLRQDIGAENVCVAHHRDDAVETLLMNLLRGTGIHGLTGIRPRNGHIVRPMLRVSRQEIEEFLDSIGQPYVTDSTNLFDNVVRNKLRLNVLPLLKDINPKAAENIYKTACRLSEAENVFNTAMESGKTRVCSLGIPNPEHGGIIDITALQQEPSPEYLLFELLSPLGFSPDSIEQIVARLDGSTGREFHSETHELVIDRDRLLVQRRQPLLQELRIPEPGIYVYSKGKVRVEQTDNIEISRDATVATLDAARVLFPLTVRPVREGDRFQPYGMTGSRLVSDYLTDLKVSLFDKRRQLVVTDASGVIIWLVGRRTDHRFRITDTTSAILRLSFFTA